MSLVRTSLVVALTLSAAACTIETPSVPSTPSDPSSASGTAADGCVVEHDIKANTTWSPELCPSGVQVKSDVAVTGTDVVLTVNPGTTVKFDDQAGLRVESGAALSAKGTADKKIHFSGHQAAPGTWLGLLYLSGSTKNELAFAVVEHAGFGSDRDRDGAVQVGLYGTEGARVAISDTQIQDNARYGIHLRDDARLLRIERTTVQRNGAGAARVQPSAVESLTGTGNSFVSNGTSNLVIIETDILVPLNEDATWPNLSPAIYRVVGQYVEGGDEITVKKHLTIAAGATFEWAGNSGLLVAGGTSGLKAVGTPDAKIVLRGIDGSAWMGVTFGESTWSENRLESVEIHDATSAPEWQYYGSGSADYRRAAILMGYNGATPVHLAMKNTLVAGAAPADLGKKASAVFVDEGGNTGRGAAGAIDIEAIPF